MSNSAASIKRIAISTGGGDAPGLNAVIRAAVLSAINRGWEVYGIRDGYNGLLMPEQYLEGGLIRLTRERVRGITHLGGTIIGTTNRGNPLKYPIKGPDGTLIEIDRSDELSGFQVSPRLMHHLCGW
jgi:6-phosphofructokinase 1